MAEKASILIVDDDKNVCQSLASLLERHGYGIETAATGQEAIEKARHRVFNMALLDIKLPDTDGIELIPPLRETHPDMAVIIITGYASLDTAVHALNKGASAYVPKPFSKEQVLATVKENLEKQRLILENKRLYQEAQQELARRKQAEELFRGLTEDSPNSIYIVQDGKFQYVNPRFQEITGCAREELLGTDPLRIVFPEDRDKTHKNAVDMLKSRHTTPYEYRIVNKLGGTRWVMENVTSIMYEGSQAALGNFIDITERKRIEEALRQSEEKTRVMFQSVTDGITITDMKGNILEANEAAARQGGYNNKEDLIGLNISELASPKEHARAMENLKRLMTERPPGTAEYIFLRKDGTEFPGEVITSLIRDASGNAAGFLAVARDITERKKMEEQLIISDRLAAIGKLASGIAHEINNPLTSVIGFSQLLLEQDLADDVKKDLEIVYDEAQRAAGMVKKLFTFARKDTSAEQLVNINTIIQEVLELRAYEQKANNIQVITQFAPDLPEVMVDPLQLHQALLNIILNAEYFMIEAHHRGTLTIATEKVGNIVRASFSDDGPGIAKGKLEHVFDPFLTTKEVGKGAGLGLSICHWIVTKYGGRIYAESELGKGATFVVELPVSNTDKEGV